MQPTISVITVTRNCAATVADCLASVAAQRGVSCEHIVIDGASTDATLDILGAHREQLSVLVSEPDGGLYHALNKGIAHARGDVIGFLHADDLYADEEVLSQIAQAFTDPSVCAVYGDLQYVQSADVSRVVRHWKSAPFSAARLHWGWMPPHPTLYVRRQCYARLGGFNTRFRIAADYDFMLRLLSQLQSSVGADVMGSAVYIPRVLVKMRVGGASNRSVRAITRKSVEDYQALRLNGFSVLGAAGALMWKNLSKLRQFF